MTQNWSKMEFFFYALKVLPKTLLLVYVLTGWSQCTCIGPPNNLIFPFRGSFLGLLGPKMTQNWSKMEFFFLCPQSTPREASFGMRAHWMLAILRSGLKIQFFSPLSYLGLPGTSRQSSKSKDFSVYLGIFEQNGHFKPRTVFKLPIVCPR